MLLSTLVAGKPRNESTVVQCMGDSGRQGDRKSGLYSPLSATKKRYDFDIFLSCNSFIWEFSRS